MTAKTCMAAAAAATAPPGNFLLLLKQLGGERCGKPAAFDTPLGPRCHGCIEAFKTMARNPHAVINMVASARARTEDEIARMIVPIEPEKMP